MAVYDIREVVRMNDRYLTSESGDKMTREERVHLCKQQLAAMKDILENGTFLNLDFSSIERRNYMNTPSRATQLYLIDPVWITDRGSVKVNSVFLMKDTENANHNFTLIKLIKGQSITSELRDHFLAEIDICQSHVY